MIPGSSPVASVPVGGASATTGALSGPLISTNVLDKSTKETYWLLEFSFASSATLLLTNNNEPLTGPNGTYQATPDLDLFLPPSTGFFNEVPLKVKVPNSVATLFQELSFDTPHSPVSLNVYELTFDDTYYRTQLRFKGKLDKTSFSLMGESGILELEFISNKEVLNIPLGLIATNQCQLIFGQGKCLAVVQEEFIFVETISNTRIIHFGDPLPQTNGYFIRGFAEFNGLRITIREWDNSIIFHLARQPPASWLNKTIKVVGGCNKSIGACRDPQRNREIDFFGLGVGMPDHNPITETS